MFPLIWGRFCWTLNYWNLIGEYCFFIVSLRGRPNNLVEEFLSQLNFVDRKTVPTNRDQVCSLSHKHIEEFPYQRPEKMTQSFFQEIFREPLLTTHRKGFAFRAIFKALKGSGQVIPMLIAWRVELVRTSSNQTVVCKVLRIQISNGFSKPSCFESAVVIFCCRDLCWV